ncbi:MULTISPECIES: DSD1 family PLP-dependent enzyme [Pseudomonas]|uniref:Metal-activated pyridoxal enzyme n=2 Tax=Pseudomonas fluorescens TaxID=294 RepID=C3JZC1_PSEFS|nr:MULTISPECIES: DSD1 family PLP-dependent enzyme [Pseudomonas]KJZ46118.1 alanine racemase [Pseudomonas marginalis]KJZ51839.1 alanine racemase [Pseudomonas marginalis]MBZ6459543.1 DSD1 family PLP-dependent enzyme [Pseudomonas fluorescens group sp.]MBZ6465756.1 DSD1 family PLP-dependent enzyme [Pseudomonas fluorescens group sp.]MBZ6468855.1 DSD1 family PLP-dependent enzyme [Pseudomonas fluorescens group sp.]
MPTPIAALDTPAALIDIPRMQHNIQRMQQRMNTLGVRLRPHIKTSKCLPVIQAQLAAGASGVTVSTLKEAQHCFSQGILDVFYAVAVAPGKLPQALALRRQGCNLSLLTDSVAGAQALVAFAQQHDERLDVWIEIDCDGHRSGLAAEDEALLDVARILSDGGMHLRGVMTHAGSSYELDTPEALQVLAEQERALCVRAAQRIRATGLACPDVSIGSTPTALSALNLDGVTEVRAGVYVFFDLVMHNIGVCQPDELALSVLTSVIGHQPEKGWVITDAGWMAMSRDRGTQRQRQDFGYGQVCSEAGVWLEGARVTGANQEHGIITLHTVDGDDITERFPIGSRLRILPNHACATGAQFPDYHALDADGGVHTWSRLHGW